jgi:hypothetical protein
MNFTHRYLVEDKIAQTTGHDDADARLVGFSPLKGMIGQLPRTLDEAGDDP